MSLFQRTENCIIHLTCFTCVDGCKEKLFTAEQDLKRYCRTGT